MKERSAFLGELLLNSGKRIHPQLPLPSRILDLVGLIEEMHPSIHTLNHDVHPVVSGLIVVVVKMQRRYPARRSRRPSSIFPFRDDKVLSDLTCNRATFPARGETYSRAGYTCGSARNYGKSAPG